jgi:hypothetical protein
LKRNPKPVKMVLIEKGNSLYPEERRQGRGFGTKAPQDRDASSPLLRPLPPQLEKQRDHLIKLFLAI